MNDEMSCKNVCVLLHNACSFVYLYMIFCILLNLKIMHCRVTDDRSSEKEEPTKPIVRRLRLVGCGCATACGI